MVVMGCLEFRCGGGFQYINEFKLNLNLAVTMTPRSVNWWSLFHGTTVTGLSYGDSVMGLTPAHHAKKTNKAS